VPSGHLVSNGKLSLGSDIDFHHLDDAGIDIIVAGPESLLSASDDDVVWGYAGSDTIRGGAGNDEIRGGLGSDTIVGGAGRDVIYGGSGTRAGRNDRGDPSADGHARDADVILGDNGRIFRVVGLNGAAIGGYLQFNYDTYGGLKVVPRTIVYLGYAFGQASNTAFNDEIHGEAGDDAIHGMSGNDALFGDGQDDDIVGGQGDDRMSGGTGEDGMLGDDGRIFTSRNGLLEPVHGVLVATTQGATQLPGTVIGAVTNLAGRLKKSVDLAAFYTGGHDVMYGGEGDDFMHGGAGDDAMSGAEAQATWYVTTALSGSVLGYNPTTRKFAAYDAADALSMARFRASDLVVETKPDLTPVTEADRAVEEMIRDHLAEVRPDDAVLGEEFFHKGGDPAPGVVGAGVGDEEVVGHGMKH
jgi:Ca2+-binding RTX toxin-like protein